jgi:hypothetical protein
MGGVRGGLVALCVWLAVLGVGSAQVISESDCLIELTDGFAGSTVLNLTVLAEHNLDR